MNLLKNANSARDAEGNFHSRQCHLHIDGLEMAPVENGDIAIAVAE